jgi:glyoxylase-like metal-dependent hydrolase (beta-lactamase superfamily II)
MVKVCTYVWYIENSAPKILVDAGVSAADFIAHGDSQEDVQPLEIGLQKIGVRPEEIDIVILTHLHYDHIALARLFMNARFIVQKKELDAARNPHPMIVSWFEKELYEGLNFKVVDGDAEIVEGVKVLLTPGHTPGGQSVAVETAGGLAVITGFCCIKDTFYPPQHIVEKEGLQVMAPGLILDALQAYDSALRVKQCADVIIPLHDIEFINKDRIPDS